MQREDPVTNRPELSGREVAEIRGKAVKRSWICPGAGFAWMGHSALATLTFVATLLAVPVAVWVASRPSGASLWTFLIVLVIAIALWLVEQMIITKLVPRPPRPAMLASGFTASTCVVWIAYAVTIGLIVTAFGSLRMGGVGMSPTLVNGERLIYHKHLDGSRVKPGAIVVYKNGSDSAWGRPGFILVSRILAGPGNKISIQDGRYVVNGVKGPMVADTGRYDPVLDIPLSPNRLEIPEGCYFIVQDSAGGGFDSRVLSWARTESIVGSQLWYLSGRGLFKPVE